MDKLVKTSTYAGGGGLIVSGGIAIEEYFIEDSGEEVTYAPTHQVVIAPEGDQGKTVEEALKNMGLTLATTIDEFKEIFEDIKKAGFFGWGSQIMKNTYGITNSRSSTIPSTMKKRCDAQLKRKLKEFSSLKSTEFKTIKIVCTKNYSVTDNAKDHWSEEDSIHESTKIESNKWKQQIEDFKKVKSSGTIDDLKQRCVSQGKEPYRKYQEGVNGGDFYRFCVLGRGGQAA